MASDPLSWQERCTDTLEQAVTAGGTTGMTHWESFREQAERTGDRILIADADFSYKDLRGLDLSRCWIGRTNFTGANLSQASFAQTIFRECDATNATIEGTNFRNADLQGDGLVLNTNRYDDTTNMEIARDKMPDSIGAGLLLAAERARRTRLWRHRKSQSWVVRAILWLTGYGFSFTRLALCGVLIVLVFATGFWWAGTPAIEALLASASYFMSLNTAFTSPGLSAIGTAEALLGMIFFALLTTILVSLFFDKN
jgi:hypothetical protein